MAVNLFPQSPLFLPHRLMKKVAMVAGMDIMHGLSNMGFLSLTKAEMAAATLEYPTCQQQRLTLTHDMASLPQVISQFPGGQLIILSSWKEQHFVLTGIDTYLVYGFTFPAHNTSVQILFVNLQNAIFTIIVFHTALLSTKELHSLRSMAMG